MKKSIVFSCEQFRLHAGAVPGDQSLPSRLHRWMCTACRRYERDLLALDEKIKAAFRRPPREKP